jgi:hypothetical protein
MALTQTQAITLLIQRVATLEKAVQNLQIIISKKGSKQQMRQTLVLREQEIEELKERIEIINRS